MNIIIIIMGFGSQMTKDEIDGWIFWGSLCDVAYREAIVSRD